MPDLNTHDLDSLTGATYFVVGRGTEGGQSSYHLSIAGVTSGTSDPNWGTQTRYLKRATTSNLDGNGVANVSASYPRDFAWTSMPSVDPDVMAEMLEKQAETNR